MKIDSILTPKILAKKFGTTEETIRSWRDQGLPIVKIGKFVFIIEESFLKWIKSHESVQDAPGQELIS